MFRRFLYFVSYHNALPLILGFLFLSVGAAMAASPDVRDSLYNSTETTVSIDNSYIRNINLDTYTPKIQITSVEEDQLHYYVGYTLDSINVLDHSWQDVVEKRMLKVWKDNLGKRDLGLYVTSELAQVVDKEMDRLRKTQSIEKENGISQEVVSTVYSGLIGKFLDSKEEVLPGYIPIKNEIVESETTIQPPVVVSSPAGAEHSPLISETSVEGSGGGNGDVTPPTLTILGNNPAQIALNTPYADLGVVVSDNVNNNLGVSYAVDGSLVTEVEIDTSVVGTHIVVYSAVDQAGNRRTVERVVNVFNPNTPSVEEDSSSSATSSSEIAS